MPEPGSPTAKRRRTSPPSRYLPRPSEDHDGKESLLGYGFRPVPRSSSKRVGQVGREERNEVGSCVVDLTAEDAEEEAADESEEGTHAHPVTLCDESDSETDDSYEATNEQSTPAEQLVIVELSPHGRGSRHSGPSPADCLSLEGMKSLSLESEATSRCGSTHALGKSKASKARHVDCSAPEHLSQFEWVDQDAFSRNTGDNHSAGFEKGCDISHSCLGSSAKEPRALPAATEGLFATAGGDRAGEDVALNISREGIDVRSDMTQEVVVLANKPRDDVDLDAALTGSGNSTFETSEAYIEGSGPDQIGTSASSDRLSRENGERFPDGERSMSDMGARLRTAIHEQSLRAFESEGRVEISVGDPIATSDAVRGTITIDNLFLLPDRLCSIDRTSEVDSPASQAVSLPDISVQNTVENVNVDEKSPSRSEERATIWRTVADDTVERKQQNAPAAANDTLAPRSRMGAAVEDGADFFPEIRLEESEAKEVTRDAHHISVGAHMRREMEATGTEFPAAQKNGPRLFAAKERISWHGKYGDMVPNSISSVIEIDLTYDPARSMSAVEEISARGMTLPSTFIGRIMSKMLESQCLVRTELLRRQLWTALSARACPGRVENRPGQSMCKIVDEIIELSDRAARTQRSHCGALAARVALLEAMVGSTVAIPLAGVERGPTGDGSSLSIRSPLGLLGAQPSRRIFIDGDMFHDLGGRDKTLRCARWMAEAWESSMDDHHTRDAETPLCTCTVLRRVIPASVCASVSKLLGDTITSSGLSVGAVCEAIYSAVHERPRRRYLTTDAQETSVETMRVADHGFEATHSGSDIREPGKDSSADEAEVRLQVERRSMSQPPRDLSQSTAASLWRSLAQYEFSSELAPKIGVSRGRGTRILLNDLLADLNVDSSSDIV